MECFVYANMLLANEGETEYDLPRLKFNWKKCFKSVWLNFASLSALLTILTQVQLASAHYATTYVSTNGSCLNVRTGPGLDYDVINCVCNGSSLPPVVNYEHGFAQLRSGHWVAAEWISDTHSYGHHGHYGVGGEYSDYFHHRYHHRYHHHHHDDYANYSSESSYPRHNHQGYADTEYYPERYDRDYESTEYQPERYDRDYESTEYHPGHYDRDYESTEYQPRRHHRDYESNEYHLRHNHRDYESAEYYLNHYHHHYH